jgi:hypothetical protein
MCARRRVWPKNSVGLNSIGSYEYFSSLINSIVSFPYLSFVYQSFIPQSVGRSLSEIFRDHPHLNRQDMVNYDEFMAFLRRTDATGRRQGHGGSWIPEPPPISTLKGTFAMTNDGEFEPKGNSRRHTTNKVSIEGRLDLREVGRMSTVFLPVKVPSAVTAFQCRAAIVPQTSNINVGYPTIRPVTGRYVGVFSAPEPAISHISGRISLLNKSEGTYFTKPGTPAEELFDTTIIRAKAAGNYPFVWVVAPDIDITLTIKLRRFGNRIEIQFEGLHDQFPAYELLVNGVRQRRWDPVANGQHGPNPINLNANYLKQQVRTSFSMHVQIPDGYKAPAKASLLGLNSPINATFGVPRRTLSDLI